VPWSGIVGDLGDDHALMRPEWLNNINFDIDAEIILNPGIIDLSLFQVGGVAAERRAFIRRMREAERLVVVRDARIAVVVLALVGKQAPVLVAPEITFPGCAAVWEDAGEDGYGHVKYLQVLTWESSIPLLCAAATNSGKTINKIKKEI
jgi:hypothetical protein